jgi:hypothetical protein
MLTCVVAFRRTEFNICLVLHGLTQFVQVVLAVLDSLPSLYVVSEWHAPGCARDRCCQQSYRKKTRSAALRQVDPKHSKD